MRRKASDISAGYVARKILAWYSENGRTFPWRNGNLDAWQVLVTEILLQQTPAARVARHLPRIFGEFPTLDSLATASRGRVETAIRPLGLHRRRAATLRALARELRKFSRPPRSESRLRTLPGVGPYVLSAYLSVTANESLATIDVNVARILTRAFGARTRSDLRADEVLHGVATELVSSSGDPRSCNWALLDLAALVCTPSDPLCHECPIQLDCGAANDKKPAPREIEPSAGGQSVGPVFVDLFAGCGGLSLGLLSSGWNCAFAVERSSDAFATYSHNLLFGRFRNQFQWPAWLSKQEWPIGKLVRQHEKALKGLVGTIDVVVGGPPCQGFSFAGKRKPDDPRNGLFRDYVRFIELVQPRAVLVENVGGIAVGHRFSKKDRKRKSYLKRITDALKRAGYITLEPETIRAESLGVPQRRPRVFVVGIRKDLWNGEPVPTLAMKLDQLRAKFLREKDLDPSKRVSVKSAISDLEKGRVVACLDGESPRGFEMGLKGAATSAYQTLLRRQDDHEVADSHRFANHRPDTTARFKAIGRLCRRGVQLSATERSQIAPTKKHVLVVLAAKQVAHTITTLPDDLLHYSEPRILTVRETARLQSFPDWFHFKGKYTTGGPVRTSECPRYTQVGNAVPPLVAEAIGRALEALLTEATAEGN